MVFNSIFWHFKYIRIYIYILRQYFGICLFHIYVNPKSISKIKNHTNKLSTDFKIYYGFDNRNIRNRYK